MCCHFSDKFIPKTLETSFKTTFIDQSTLICLLFLKNIDFYIILLSSSPSFLGFFNNCISSSTNIFRRKTFMPFSITWTINLSLAINDVLWITVFIIRWTFIFSHVGMIQSGVAKPWSSNKTAFFFEPVSSSREQ